jgi:TPR repeat protein
MRIPKMSLTKNDRIKKDPISDLRRKADQGDAEAQFDLGLSYVLGWGVPQDYAIAGQWHEKAAAQGYARAMSFLRELNENTEAKTRAA